MRWIQTELEKDPSRIDSVVTLSQAEAAPKYDPNASFPPDLENQDIGKTQYLPKRGLIIVVFRGLYHKDKASPAKMMVPSVEGVANGSFGLCCLNRAHGRWD